MTDDKPATLSEETRQREEDNAFLRERIVYCERSIMAIEIVFGVMLALAIMRMLNS